MGMVPGAGLVSLFDNFVDRAIGADELPHAVREKLLQQQLASISRMSPAIFAAATVVSAIFLILTWQTARFGPIAVGTGVILIVHAHIFFLTRGRRAGAAEPHIHRAALVAVIYALVLGMLWALILNVLPVDQDATVRGAATIMPLPM